MPVIGYNQICGTSGTTAINWTNEAQIGAAHRYVGVTGDTVTKVWAYGSGTGDCEIGLYVFSGGVPTTKVASAVVSIGATLGWYSTDVSWTLTNGVEYCVAIDYYANGDWVTYYDASDGTISVGNSDGALPATWTQTSTGTYRMSYYAEVTSGGGATVPSAITDLAGSAGDTQVSLTWTAPSDGGSAITDYNVQYRDTSAPAFPVIPTVAAGRVLTAVQADTTATRTFPSLTGLTKNAGDRLIAICIAYQTSTGTNAAFSGWTGGFTEIHDSASSTTMAIGVAEKVSDGTETGTFAVTQAGTITGHACFILLSIPGAHASTASEVGGRASTTAATQADPTALNPAGWDAENTLWVAIHGDGETSLTGSYTGVASGPANYSDYVDTGMSGDVIGAVEGAVAFRQLNAASEDAGAFTADTSNSRHAAVLLAVRPSAAAAWQTFSDGTSSTPGATVTGLTNNVPYEFQARAVNAIGNGAWSNTAGPYTPQPPTPIRMIQHVPVTSVHRSRNW